MVVKGSAWIGGVAHLPPGRSATGKMGVLGADGKPAVKPGGEAYSATEKQAILDKEQQMKNAEMGSTMKLSNDRRGQYDPSVPLSLEARTKLANDFINKSTMGRKRAKSFVDKANRFSNGTAREYSNKQTFVDSNNRLYALSSNGKDFVYIGTFLPDGKIY